MESMSNGTSSAGKSASQPRDAFSVLFPALGVGVATGTCGLVYGSVVSTLIQSPNPRVYTALSTVQWFAAGTTFFCIRTLALRASPSPERPLHRVLASGLAGSFSGAMAAQFLPRGAFLSGTIGFGVLGMGAQLGINAFGDSVNGIRPGSFTKRLAAWSPMKALTDEEYEKILQQKLLKVEVEISLVDDQIAELRRLSAQQQGRASSSTDLVV